MSSIEEVVYMPSPVRIDFHGRPHAQIMAWLGAYWIATPGVDLADTSTVYLDSKLQTGLQTTAHAVFVERLTKA